MFFFLNIGDCAFKLNDLNKMFSLFRYSLMNNFEAEAKGAVLDLTGDSNTTMVAKKNAMKWDVRKKKYVRADQVTKSRKQECFI